MPPLSSDYRIGKHSFIWPDFLSRKKKCEYVSYYPCPYPYNVFKSVDKNCIKIHMKLIKLLITLRLESERDIKRGFEHFALPKEEEKSDGIKNSSHT